MVNSQQVTFKWKDYRAKTKYRYKTMTLSVDKFIRRFLLHVLPSGFHRIRHYGILTNASRKENIATARQLLIEQTERPILNQPTRVMLMKNLLTQNSPLIAVPNAANPW